MSNGINQTNSTYIDNYEDVRFQDASQAIFFKYRKMGMIKPTAPTASVNVTRDRHEKTVRSQACTIL